VVWEGRRREAPPYPDSLTKGNRMIKRTQGSVVVVILLLIVIIASVGIAIRALLVTGDAQAFGGPAFIAALAILGLIKHLIKTKKKND